jgi:hypothetical protein
MVEQKRTRTAKGGHKLRGMSPRITTGDLAKLGGGKLAYIKMLSSDEANKMYPAVKGLPKGISLFALHAADGTPLALTDSRQAAIGHAMGDKLRVESLH